VAETLKTPVGLAGNFPLEVEEPAGDILDGPAPGGNLKILVDGKLGNREAIMDLQ